MTAPVYVAGLLAASFGAVRIEPEKSRRPEKISLPPYALSSSGGVSTVAVRSALHAGQGVWTDASISKGCLVRGRDDLLDPRGRGGFVVSQTKVPPEAIQAAVIRNEDAIERACQLPVASTFKREVKWQSNASLCGPASAANIFRSLGEAATSEAAVLAGTGRCWTGFCIMGLTLDELAEVMRKNTKRTITVLRDLSPDAFRQHLKQSNDPGRRFMPMRSIPISPCAPNGT